MGLLRENAVRNHHQHEVKAYVVFPGVTSVCSLVIGLRFDLSSGRPHDPRLLLKGPAFPSKF